ncbi:hypothetical protein ABZ953_06950 [Streptomyces sp. NPDC046465]|uniref:hypothetical protein n=1 Tax=Streptomyces sp. NPDC046465 TaxID=3155810 RepID=UPI0033FD2350
MPADYEPAFSKDDDGMTVCVDGFHVKTVPRADRAERTERDDGYNFYDVHGSFVGYSPDWLLQRIAHDKALSVEFGKLLNQTFGNATPPITTSDVPAALRGPRWKP